MKISEIRNKFFGLSDLKSLINESALGENMNWKKFFQDYPQFLDDKYAEMSKEQFWSDDDLLNAIANYPGSQYPYLTDKERVMALDNDTEKNIRKKGFRDKRLETLGQKQGKTKKRDKPISIGGFTQNNANFGNTDKPTSLMRTPFEYLEMFFKQNFNSGLLDYNEGESITDYLNGIRSFASEAYDELKIDAFNGSNMVWDSNNPSFFLFLLFYYADHCKKGGRTNKNMTNDYIDAIEVPEIKEAVEKIIGKNRVNTNEENDKAFFTFVEETFLSPVGLSFNTPLTTANLQKIYNQYFADEGKILATWNIFKPLSKETSFRLLNNYAQCVGGVLAAGLYILNLDKTKQIDNLSNNIAPFLGGNGLFKDIRSKCYLVKYKNDFSGKPESPLVSTNFRLFTEVLGGKSVYDLFDPFENISNELLTSAIEKIIRGQVGLAEGKVHKNPLNVDIEGMTRNDVKAKLRDISALGLPNYSSPISLTPAERLIELAKGMNYIVSRGDINWDLFGGEEYGFLSNLFKPADEIYKMQTGNDNQITAFRKLGAEAEGEYGENLTYGQIISYYFGQRDKNQKEIYMYLLSNLPQDINVIYEYNRQPNQVDPSLGNLSIDIVCEGRNGNPIVCIEYQGEQHYRGRYVSPKDESNDDKDGGILYEYTRMKDSILETYEKNSDEYEQRAMTLKIRKPSKQEDENGSRFLPPYIKDELIKTAYEKEYSRLTGLDFEKTWREYNPFVSDDTKEMNEGKKKKKLQFANPKEEWICYIYAILLQYFKIQITPDMMIPKGLVLKMDTKKFLCEVYPGADYVLPFLGSPNRFSNEIHAACQKKSDIDKSRIIKNHRWPFLCVLPSAELQTVTEEDFKYTSEVLANPKGEVYEWGVDNAVRDYLLQGVKKYFTNTGNIGGTMIQEETLFQNIVRELVSDNSF